MTYLVAWADGRAVGHALVRWGGPTNPELRWLLGPEERHPYVEALLVHPSLRSRSVGTQILAAAEALVTKREIRRHRAGRRRRELPCTVALRAARLS